YDSLLLSTYLVPAVFPYTTLFRSWASGLCPRLGRCSSAPGGASTTSPPSNSTKPSPRSRWHASATSASTRTPSTAEVADACQRRSGEHTSELQSRFDLVCRLLLEQ